MTKRIDYTHGCLRVSSETLNQLYKFMESPNPQKIQAIKLLRSETACGLKEAKLAIEKRFQPNLPLHADALDIRPLISIKSITVDFGEGNVELSLDDLQMMTLVNMNQLGLSEVRRVLDLHEILTRWEDPKEEPSADTN